MLELSSLDLDEIAMALADQTDYEHRWLINPESGEIAFWTADGGIDGQTPVDLDELDLVCIDPEPSYVWYQDMVDFVEGISDDRAGRSLGRAIQGRGAGIGQTVITAGVNNPLTLSVSHVTGFTFTEMLAT